MENRKVGFIGAGGIARAHAFALNALKFYYDDVPDVEMKAVSSAREESRQTFAKKYGFETALDLNGLLEHQNIDTVYILGPNSVHFSHLDAVLKMDNVQRIYLEKPICSTFKEEEQIRNIVKQVDPGKDIRVGFQMLSSSAIRKALELWHSNLLGRPVHFRFNYMHRDYLDKNYRDKRQSRLSPAPDGGAMADLGSHAISLMTAFLGSDLTIVNALQSGSFYDVPESSDLYSEISVLDTKTDAVGNLSASRISSGMGDVLNFEIFAEKGALRYNSYYPDRFDYFVEEENVWKEVFTGSDYKPITAFPSGHVPGGWLRSLIHAHYAFLTGCDNKDFVPDLAHGLEVQRLVRETADFMKQFRELRGKY